jgi:hypothetical protein
MVEKIVSALFYQITALTLIVTLTVTVPAAAEVGVSAAPQPQLHPGSQADVAQATFTDNDLRAILATLSMPYGFKNVCTSFKPPHEPSSENIQKFVPAKLSDNPEAIDRITRLAQDEKMLLEKMAAMSGAWLRKKIRHPWLGGPRRLSMYLATLDCATANPSLSSSP